MADQARPLAGKVAVVTGGGTGAGQGIALMLAQAGCQVVVTGRRLEKLQETVASFTGDPAILAHELDVADRQSVSACFAWVRKQAGEVDLLVNNAGINVQHRSMAELSPEDWDKLLAINATGAFNCLREVLPGMRQRGDGMIVNISSVAGKRASVLGGVGYSAAKFAMTALGMTAGLEVNQDGVRITNIYPGEIATPILDMRPEPVSEERKAAMLQPEDIAAAVLMVACLPPRAHIPELVIKPTKQAYA